MRRCYLLLLLALPLAFATALAGGPNAANGTTPRRYAAGSFPLSYRVDQGPLGTFANATAAAIADYAFRQWDLVASASVSFTNAGALARDVTQATDAYISGNGQFSDGVNPVVFDTDGSITDAKLGAGAKNSVLGFASSAYSGNNYVEGYVIINGFLSGSGGASDQDRYRATITHEVGHFLGLGHSQVAMHADFATMYPLVVKTAQQTLDPDDTAAIANLYPAAGYTATVGSISGTVRSAAGANLSGVNVIAQNTSTGAAYSTLVDYFSGGKAGFDNAPAATGTYTLTGLPPGSYNVRIEPVNANFTGGSSVGSYNTPSNTNITSEWYNGIGESGDMLIDNLNQQTTVGVTAATTTGGINLVENTSSTLSSLIYHDGMPSVAFTLPQGSVTGYATRFTAPVTGSLVSIKFRFQGNSTLPQNGTLTITVHANTAGSIAGIPGAALGSVTVSFRDLAADQLNEVWLRSIGGPINFIAGQDFHVAFTSNGVGTPVFLTDDGNPTQNRSSYLNSGVWRNFGDGGYATGYNLIVYATYSNAVLGTPVPRIASSPTALDFGTIRPGATVDRTVRISNPGTATLNVTSTPILGTDSLDYRIVSGGGAFSLLPGGTRDMVVRFAPLRAGGREDPSKSARLTVVSNADPSPYNIPLVGNAVQPLATRLDTTIAFGSRLVGGIYVIDTAIIRNTCTDTLHISSVTLTGPDAGGGLKLLSAGVVAVPPNEILRVRIQFTPTERRLYTATLRVNHDDSTGHTDFSVTGRGIAPVLTRSATTLQAGNVHVGRSAAMPVLTITNTGDAPMRITALRITGANASEFSFAGNPPALPLTLQPGGTLQVPLRFTPTATGVRTATLEITADSLPTAQVALTGTGVLGLLSTTTTSLDFGDVVVGSSTERSISFTNSGTDTVVIQSVGVTGAGFTVLDGPSAGARLAPGASTTLRVRFAPEGTGASSGALTVANDGAQPVVLALSGRGVQPGLAVSRSTIAYGVVRPGETRIDSFIIRNTGTAPLLVTALQLGGADASAFELLAPALPFTIAPGSSQTIRVRLNAQSSERVLAATLHVVGSNGTAADISLSATIGQGLVAVSPAVGFTMRPSNATYDTIAMVRNVTATDVTITSITVQSTHNGAPGDYFQVFNTAPFVIPAGDSVDLRIRFNPSAGGGSYAGTITLRAANPADSVTIALSGSASASSGVEREIVAGGVTLALLDVTPNPARDGARAELDVRGSGRLAVQLLLVDERGVMVRELYDGVIAADGAERHESVAIDLASLPSGMYQVLLRSARGSVARKLVIVR